MQSFDPFDLIALRTFGTLLIIALICWGIERYRHRHKPMAVRKRRRGMEQHSSYFAPLTRFHHPQDLE